MPAFWCEVGACCSNAMNLTKVCPLRAYRLEFVRNLNDADNNFVWITILVDEAELNHGVVAVDVAFHIHHLVILQVFLDVALKNGQCVGKVYFQRTRIIG